MNIITLIIERCEIRQEIKGILQMAMILYFLQLANMAKVGKISRMSAVMKITNFMISMTIRIATKAPNRPAISSAIARCEGESGTENSFGFKATMAM